MDVLFSLLDGACALWLCLFSPRRYLRIVASTNLTMMGARHFFEIYIKTLLIPAVVLASISGFTAELQENDNVVKLLGTDKVNQFLHSKEYVSITIYFGALLTYYSLARSREFSHSRRRMRHALQFITTNALTLLVIQIATTVVGSIMFLGIASKVASITLIFLIILWIFSYILLMIVWFRILIFFAKSFRIGFWRSLWLQSRFVLLAAAVILFSIVAVMVAIFAGLTPIDIVAGAVALVLMVGGVLIANPSGRSWLSRRATPAHQGRPTPAYRVPNRHTGRIRIVSPSGPNWLSHRATPARRGHVANPRAGRIRIVTGALAGMVVPVSAAIVLGRDPTKSGIVFPAEYTSVSRRHCEIRFDSTAALFEVRDLGSRNGTFIAGRANTPRRLSPGVVERLAPGHYVLVGSSRDRLMLELS